jgi:PHD/YefM family antitoxin component YafN of YafNO toxin-antitoxin module
MVEREQYVVDQEGKRTAVLLDLKYYEELVAALEEVESIRAYDEAKASKDEAIPFDQATDEIERQRR